MDGADRFMFWMLVLIGVLLLVGFAVALLAG